jgi:hypothetical protein
MGTLNNFVLILALHLFVTARAVQYYGELEFTKKWFQQ